MCDEDEDEAVVAVRDLYEAADPSQPREQQFSVSFPHCIDTGTGTPWAGGGRIK
jgi:hypothetical protein